MRRSGVTPGDARRRGPVASAAEVLAAQAEVDAVVASDAIVELRGRDRATHAGAAERASRREPTRGRASVGAQQGRGGARRARLCGARRRRERS